MRTSLMVRIFGVAAAIGAFVAVTGAGHKF